MLLATRKTKNNLVRTVLASSVLISSMAYMNPAYAVLQPIGGVNTDSDTINITGGVDFDDGLNNVNFVVKDNANGLVFGDFGTVSVGNSGGKAGNNLIFEGQSTVSGSITDIATPLNGLEVQGGKVAGNGVVTVNGNVKALQVIVGSPAPGGGGGLTLTGASELKVSGGDLTVQGIGTTLSVGGLTTVSGDILLKDKSSSTFTSAATVIGEVVLTESSNAAFTSDLTAAVLAMENNDHVVTVGGNLVLTTQLFGAGVGNSTLVVTGTSTITAGAGVLEAHDDFEGTFKGDVSAKQIMAEDNSILTFNSQGNSTTSAVAISGNAKVNFNGGGTAAAGITLINNSTVNFFNANYDVNGANLDRAGTSLIRIGTGVTVTVGGGNNMTDAGAASGLAFDFGDTLTPGFINVTGTATIDDDQFVILENYDISQLAVGTTQTSILVQDTGGGIVDVPTLLGDINNAFISFSLTNTDGDTKLNLVMTRQVPANLEGNANNLGGVFAQIDKTNATGELLDLVNGLGDIATSPEQLNEELAEIAPQGINGGIVDSSFGVTNETFDLFSQRISELRAGLDSYHTGYAAGHMTESGHGTWVKVFGNHADQSRRGNIAGYTGETWGLAVGADMMITERHLIGVSGSIGNTDVNFDSQRGGTDINSYQGAFYGSWNVTTPLFVNWMASIAYNKYKETQLISVGGFNQASLGEFDGWQYGARAELGYVFGEQCFHIVPTVDLTYNHVSFDSFRQKGNSTANQVIDYGSVSALLAGVGVKFSYDYEMQKALLQPEVHANVSYDIIGDEIDANARFVGFGTSYNVQGASVKRTDYNVGLSLTTYGHSGLGFSISYDYDWKTHYHAHSGFLRIRYER